MIQGNDRGNEDREIFRRRRRKGMCIQWLIGQKDNRFNRLLTFFKTDLQIKNIFLGKGMIVSIIEKYI